MMHGQKKNQVKRKWNLWGDVRNAC